MHNLVNGVITPLSQEEIDDFNQREIEHNAQMSEYEKIKFKYQRLERFNQEGCSDHELIVALWERIMENNPESSDAIQVKREAIKAQIPKPTI